MTGELCLSTLTAELDDITDEDTDAVILVASSPGMFRYRAHGDPAAVKAALEAALRALQPM